MSQANFFGTPEMQIWMRREVDKISEYEGRIDVGQEVKAYKKIIEWLVITSSELDEKAHFSIGCYCNDILLCLKSILVIKANKIDVDPDNFHKFNSILIDILLEYYWTSDKSDAFIEDFFNDYLPAKSSSSNVKIKNFYLYGNSFLLIRKAIGDEVIQNLGDSKLLKMEFDEREKRANELISKLENIRIGANFVLLNQGFEQIGKEKREELTEIQDSRNWWGGLLIVFLLVDLIYILVYFKLDNWQSNIITQVPMVALTLLLMYFFRLCTHEIRSLKTQLMQIKLRISLCQFIQGYSDYAKEMRKDSDKNSLDTLLAFEKIVFSNIMVDDTQMPSTFDGVEQLTNLINAVRK